MRQGCGTWEGRKWGVKGETKLKHAEETKEKESEKPQSWTLEDGAGQEDKESVGAP